MNRAKSILLTIFIFSSVSSSAMENSQNDPVEWHPYIQSLSKQLVAAARENRTERIEATLSLLRESIKIEPVVKGCIDKYGEWCTVDSWRDYAFKTSDDDFKYTPLMWVAYHGNIPAVKMLLDANKTYRGEGRLHQIKSAHNKTAADIAAPFSEVKQLIEARILKDLEEKSLNKAARLGDLEGVKIMVAAGMIKYIDVGPHNMGIADHKRGIYVNFPSALEWACCFGYKDIVEVLLNAGAQEFSSFDIATKMVLKDGDDCDNESTLEIKRDIVRLLAQKFGKSLQIGRPQDPNFWAEGY